MTKPEFEFGKLNFYFNKGIISYDPITKTEHNFSLDVLYDDNQLFWKQNCVKYEIVDEIKLINGFKKNFDNSTSFLSSIVKNRIIEAYRQYGRQKFEELQPVPERAVVFNNALIYLGNNIHRDINITKLFNDIVIQESIIKSNIIQTPHGHFFITNPIPYNFEPDKEHKCPTIDKHFKEWVIPRKNWDSPTKEDLDKVEMLYELLGYFMLPDYPIHRIFLLFGGGRNGKSSFIRISEKLIGKDNITASDITSLTEDRFGTSDLYKKLICNLGETDGHKLEKTSILKRLSGGDTINAQFKNKPKFVFRNYAKIIIGTNTLPQMQDRTFGNMSRYVIIDFPNRFPEKEDLLNNIPEQEYEALANICINKLKQLLKNRRFTGEPLPEDKARIYEEKSNPLGKFVSENCNLYVQGEIPTYEFFDRYVDWLGKNGYSVNVSKNVTISEFESRYEITKKQKDINRFGERKRYYCFDNVSWKTEKVILSEPPIEPEKEYTKQEIFDYFVNLGKIPKEKYDIDEAIRILKTKTQDIYEPRNGVYKINKGNNYGQSMDN